jgi:hypothetical protein
MKKYGGVEVAPSFLTSALDEREWSASRPDHFTPGEIANGTHWIGDWVGPRVGLDVVEKRKILPCRESNPAHSPSLYRLSYPDSFMVYNHLPNRRRMKYSLAELDKTSVWVSWCIANQL